MIPFNKPPRLGKELSYIEKAIESGKICGDGEFTKKVSELIKVNFSSPAALLTTSCTHALEMSALMIDIQEGDEVIMPSYTFVSTANAFALRGAKIKFIDVQPDTMNMNENLIEMAITPKTKAIVPVHYAGVACEMDSILDISQNYGLYVIEDAAQGIMARYKNQFLGTIGDYGCYSFHETKNYSMGEGGALLIKDLKHLPKAEIIREKGTNRNQFFRGEVDKYSWVDLGSSYLPSEINAAYVYPQLLEPSLINEARIAIWNRYYENLKDIASKGRITLPFVPFHCQHNGHMFYIKVKDLWERTLLIEYLKKNGIYAVFHYVPLHSSEAGRKLGDFIGNDAFTTSESERLLRLPLYYGLTKAEVDYISEKVIAFFTN